MHVWEEVKAYKVILLEGVYSTRYEFLPYLDYKIWVECDREERLRRGMERDGEAMRNMWINDWMVQEDKYAKDHMPHESANCIIDCTKYGEEYLRKVEINSVLRHT